MNRSSRLIAWWVAPIVGWLIRRNDWFHDPEDRLRRARRVRRAR